MSSGDFLPVSTHNAPFDPFPILPVDQVAHRLPAVNWIHQLLPTSYSYKLQATSCASRRVPSHDLVLRNATMKFSLVCGDSFIDSRTLKKNKIMTVGKIHDYSNTKMFVRPAALAVCPAIPDVDRRRMRVAACNLPAIDDADAWR